MYIGILALLLLAGAVLLLSSSFRQMHTQLRSLATEHHNAEDLAEKETHKLIRDAKHRLAGTFEEVAAEAGKLLTEAEALREESRQKTLAEIERLTLEAHQKHVQNLDIFEQKLGHLFAEVTAAVKTKSEEGNQRLQQAAEQQLQAVSAQITQHIENEFSVAREAATAYQQQLLIGVDSSALKLVKEVVTQVIGKNIKVADQEALVIQALDEVKKDHVL